VNDVHTGFTYRTKIETLRINKLDDQYAKNILVAQLFGLRVAKGVEKIAHRTRLRRYRMVCGE